MENVSGIPVIYAALGTGISPRQVVHNAFVFAMAAAKKLNKTEDSTHSSDLVDTVVTHFDAFMKNLNKQQDLIQAMRRQTNQSFRTLEALEKVKNDMISGIECLRTDHPCLCPVIDDTESNDSDTDPMQTILDYVDKHKRYPTQITQLPNGIASSQNELDELIKQAKQAKKRKL